MRNTLKKLLTKGFTSQIVEVTNEDYAWESVQELLGYCCVSSVVNNFASWDTTPQDAEYWRDILLREREEEER